MCVCGAWVIDRLFKESAEVSSATERRKLDADCVLGAVKGSDVDDDDDFDQRFWLRSTNSLSFGLLFISFGRHFVWLIARIDRQTIKFIRIKSFSTKNPKRVGLAHE